MSTTPLKQLVKRISVIIPAMNEEKTIETLYQGIKHRISSVDYGWEIIFIDDGSTDSTWNVMQELASQNSLHVRAYKFPKNRGKADALALGYQLAQGDIVFTMDADLQDDPAEIPRFIDKLEEGDDIVSGVEAEAFWSMEQGLA